MGALAIGVVTAGIGVLIAFVSHARHRRRFVVVYRDLFNFLANMVYSASSGADAPGLRSACARMETELVRLGFRFVGDIVARAPGSTMSVGLGCYLDEAGTTTAYVSVAFPISSSGIISFVSYTDDAEYSTTTSESSPATPPFSHRVVAPPGTSLEQLLLLHHAQLPQGHLLSATNTIDEQLRVLGGMQAMASAWRASCDPAVLVDMDLRGILLRNYERFGPYAKKKLRADIPRATLH